MNSFQALILGIVQGLTEFIPISSSAHLVLVPWVLGWPKPDLVFDTLVHWGTLVAVVAYFWRDLWDLAVGWVESVRHRSLNPDPRRRLAWLVIVGTIPAALAGALLQKQFEALFEEPVWPATFLLITGLLLTISELLSRRQRLLADLRLLDALAIGVAQAVAIAPGISRSGATIATGLFMGLQRDVAARYSFLLATPIIFGAGLLKLKDLLVAGDALTQAPLLVIGFTAAAVTGYGCIHFLMQFLRRGRLYVFAVYCWVIGLASLVLLALGR